VDRSALWVYGTKEYGKSHLLAALVCLLIAQNERIIYLLDCRECLRTRVGYVQTAMIFAWTDDASVQERILAMDTMDVICQFLNAREDFIFVIDQLNSLDQEPGNRDADHRGSAEVSQWLATMYVGKLPCVHTTINRREYRRYTPRLWRFNASKSQPKQRLYIRKLSDDDLAEMEQ
jgi:hypothetical protein